ncbi:hypothetical protein RCG39_08320 [Lactococcus petauri]|uniref:hypothetical protein n=1 Tax=Lactococcus TaxID=1357 RepID=UPI001BCF68BB|nr:MULTISPECIES: hypothetical protein [Lactococcus]MBS4460428.1 hypothetical protein [Lactococcus petauri]MBS4463978.1 hypothetical protein [Lactococcus garvieae]MDQ7119135.1 hypothetical protein [Lactococcus petauri]MDQ7126991.1 hypothetical protein [Lactococcus petauri]MDQ7128892.1 hypothetical protein [Lactococcus petauri]
MKRTRVQKRKYMNKLIIFLSCALLVPICYMIYLLFTDHEQVTIYFWASIASFILIFITCIVPDLARRSIAKRDDLPEEFKAEYKDEILDASSKSKSKQLAYILAVANIWGFWLLRETPLIFLWLFFLFIAIIPWDKAEKI